MPVLGIRGIRTLRPSCSAASMRPENRTPGSINATLFRRSTLTILSMADMSTIIPSPDGTVSPRKRGGPDEDATRFIPLPFASSTIALTCEVSVGRATSPGAVPLVTPASR